MLWLGVLISIHFKRSWWKRLFRKILWRVKTQTHKCCSLPWDLKCAETKPQISSSFLKWKWHIYWDLFPNLLDKPCLTKPPSEPSGSGAKIIMSSSWSSCALREPAIWLQFGCQGSYTKWCHWVQEPCGVFCCSVYMCIPGIPEKPKCLQAT